MTQPTKTRSAKGGQPNDEAPTTGAAAPDSLPDPTTLTADTVAEQFDPSMGETEAENVPTGEVRKTLAALAEVREEIAQSSQLGERSRAALASGLSHIYAQAQQLYAEPALLHACLQGAGIRVTRATFKSPCLAPVKLALPEHDPKAQSHYARVLTHCWALGLDPDQARAAIQTHGVVELARREARRQKARTGEPAGESDAEAAARFRAERRPTPLAEVDVDGADLVLLIAGRTDGGMVAYDVDDSDRRLMAAVRAALKRGSQVLGADAAPADGDGPEAEADAA